MRICTEIRKYVTGGAQCAPPPVLIGLKWSVRVTLLTVIVKNRSQSWSIQFPQFNCTAELFNISINLSATIWSAQFISAVQWIILSLFLHFENMTPNCSGSRYLCFCCFRRSWFISERKMYDLIWYGIMIRREVTLMIMLIVNGKTIYI